MQQRGRKSIANVVALNVTGSPPRLTPPPSLSEPERKIFAATVAACDHLRPSDLPLLCRYVEVVALSDHAAERLRTDVMKCRPSHWLATQERLVKLMVVLGVFTPARFLALFQTRNFQKAIAPQAQMQFAAECCPLYPRPRSRMSSRPRAARAAYEGLLHRLKLLIVRLLMKVLKLAAARITRQPAQ